MEGTKPENDFANPPLVKPILPSDPPLVKPTLPSDQQYYQSNSGNGFAKVIGFFVIIAIVVGLGYYGFTRTKQPENPVENQEEQTVRPTDPPPPISSVISVYAAGKPVNGIYPNLELYIDNFLVKSVENIKGDVDNSVFDLVEFTSDNKIQPDRVSIRTNNLKGQPATKSDYLYIEKINIDGADFAADDPKVYTTYTDNPASYCVSGYNKTHWLNCNGYFTFGGDQPAVVGILPTPTTALFGNVIKIYAAGTALDGVYPVMKLVVNGETLATFNNVQGDVSKGLMQEFSYTYSGPVLGRNIQIVYTNDANKPPQDRNLYIDHISFNGVNYSPDSESVYSTGTWTGKSCTPGNTKNRQLNCNGYLQFNTPTQ